MGNRTRKHWVIPSVLAVALWAGGGTETKTVKLYPRAGQVVRAEGFARGASRQPPSAYGLKV